MHNTTLDASSLAKIKEACVKGTEFPKDVQDLLIDLSHTAKSYSYSPYSKFRVGCALLGNSGKVYLGCNVENASYGGCICAERTAITKAVSEGEKQFLIICVTTDLVETYCTPCGICRQYIVEFGKDIWVISCRPDKQFKKWRIRDLLPESFGPEDLQKERTTA